MTELHPEVKKYLDGITRRGGNATKAKYGSEHYKEMRRKSGEAKAAKKTVDKSL